MSQVWRDWGATGNTKKSNIPTRKDWMEKSKCAGMLDFDSPTSSELEQQKAICNACPVKNFCLEYALAHNEKGFWAGTTAKDRLAHPREQRVSPVECHSTSEWLNVPREFDRPTLDIPKKPSLARVQALFQELDVLFA